MLGLYSLIPEIIQMSCVLEGGEKYMRSATLREDKTIDWPWRELYNLEHSCSGYHPFFARDECSSAKVILGPWEYVLYLIQYLLCVSWNTKDHAGLWSVLIVWTGP